MDFFQTVTFLHFSRLKYHIIKYPDKYWEKYIKAKNRKQILSRGYNRLNNADALGDGALICYNIARARSPIKIEILCSFRNKIHTYMFSFVSGTEKDFTEFKERLYYANIVLSRQHYITLQETRIGLINWKNPRSRKTSLWI